MPFCSSCVGRYPMAGTSYTLHATDTPIVWGGCNEATLAIHVGNICQARAFRGSAKTSH